MTTERRRLVQERREGETPAGGAYSIITFMGRGGGYAPREEAVIALICEYDSEDNLIQESFADYDPAKDPALAEAAGRPPAG